MHIIERGSKLGVHTLRPNRVGEFASTLAAAGTRFPVVMAVDDWSVLEYVRQVSPQTVTIARLHVPGLEGSNNPDDAADLMRPLLDKLDREPHWYAVADYFAVQNEADPPLPQGYADLGEVAIRTMRIAESAGFRLMILNLNNGTPEWDRAQGLVGSGVFEVARAGGHILGLHEGPQPHGAPIDLWFDGCIPTSRGSEDWMWMDEHRLVTGPHSTRPPEGFRPGAGGVVGRYRWLLHLIPPQHHVNIVISEFYAGVNLSMSQPLPPEMVAKIAWADAIYRNDPQILGFTPFTLGPTSQWVLEDWEWCYPALVDYAISIKDEPNASATPEPDPATPAPPVPPLGLPRVQYPRTYVLLPPGAGAEWARAVVDAAWDEWRWTIGGSADDAGLGALIAKRVLVVNPDAWSDDLRPFFDRYYPGTQVYEVRAATPNRLRELLSSWDWGEE